MYSTTILHYHVKQTDHKRPSIQHYTFIQSFSTYSNEKKIMKSEPLTYVSIPGIIFS